MSLKPDRGFLAGPIGLAFLVASCSLPGNPQPTPTITLDPVALGREIYHATCADCHGPDGRGGASESGAPPLDSTGHAWHHPDQQIRDWIIHGKPGLGRAMPALGDQLTDEEVEAVIIYMHTLWTADQLETQQDVTSRYSPHPER